MADASGEPDEETRRPAPWHDERPSYIDDEECRVALEELLRETGVLPSTLRSRAHRARSVQPPGITPTSSIATVAARRRAGR